MVKINLPKEILGKEVFKTLPAKEKEEYMHNLLKSILELNTNGITISQIRESTGLTYSSIWHHLEVLNCVAQCRKISRGNIDVYYPIGKVSYLNEYSINKEVQYIINKVENDEGGFICIYEKRQSRLGSYTVCKGISIPLKLVNDVINDLEKIKKTPE